MPTPAAADDRVSALNIDIEIETTDWSEALPRAEALTAEAAEAALRGEQRRGVAILLTDDDTVRDLNRRYRLRDAPTNVLSFPAIANAHGELGDIALAVGVCASEARAQSKPLDDHLRHLVIHGVLHLLGYDRRGRGRGHSRWNRSSRELASMGVP